MKKVFLLVFVSLLATQCAKKNQTMDDQLSAKRDTVSAEEQAGQKRSQEPGEAEQAAASVLQTIYFPFDAYTLSDEARDRLAEIGRFLKRFPSVRLGIEGYCDERGSAEYNMALGQRRADEVKNYLVQYGINAGRFTTTSWGEERPAVEGSSESAWSKNRRAEFQRLD